MRSALLVLCVMFVAACGGPTPGTCSTSGTGTIAVTYSGLPAGATGSVTLTGPTSQTVTNEGSLSVGAGDWAVSGQRVTVADPLVRTVYAATASPAQFCLGSGATQAVTVTWSRVATSHALWTLNGNSNAQVVGFDASLLATSGMPTASITSRGPAGNALAFDRDGNVWAAGPTTVDAALNRFAAASFAASGMVRPDRELNLAGASCIPLVGAVAFDRDGNLYVASPCANEVFRVSEADLRASGTVTPALSIPVQDPGGLAFDAAGNLWVVARADKRVWRFDAAQLAGGSVAAPAFKLGFLVSPNPANTETYRLSWLAFDAHGDLWANDFGSNTFVRAAAASLAASGTNDEQPQVRVTLGVSALLEGFAFDGEGTLWSAASSGTVVGITATQLTMSTGPGAPTMPDKVTRSPDLGAAGSIAFYPAPAGLPLYHALP